MTRRCSHCSNNGHNSRTCPGRGGGVRLFGVRLMEGVGTMKKSASMGCLPSASPSGDPLADAHLHSPVAAASGYASDDPARGVSSNCRSERKKGIPWTEEEHRMFLMGLQKLGKGDWRGIARNFVTSRTPTQVASHAQKYFIRQSNASRRKRRSSLFDMVPETVLTHDQQLFPQSPNELEVNYHSPTLYLGQQGPEPVEPSQTKLVVESTQNIQFKDPIATMLPTIHPNFITVPVPSWPGPPNSATSSIGQVMAEPYKIVKPTPLFPTEPVNVDEVVSMSNLSIADGSRMELTDLSLKLMGSSSPMQSALHANTSIAVPDLNKNNNSPIHAV
ncbi:transcription factor MYBS3-like [Curcuma longa]|uniref:transcription factor MYBS3-like n=1 Tax=Curcuma longa TaxID=136217 RepID=UPI003D9F95BE